MRDLENTREHCLVTFVFLKPLIPRGVSGSQFERERRPKTRPLGVGTGRRRNHMYGFNQPHPARPQPESHTAVVVSASYLLLRRMQTVHGNDQRARERTFLVRQPNRKILASADCVRV